MKTCVEIERIWQDNDFFEIKIICSSDMITAATKVYTTDENIDDLSNKIKNFIDGVNDKDLWENGEKGDETTAFISLEFSHKDNLGHVLIEVYMELDDGSNLSKHNCCFYVETEIGLLEKFYKNLQKLKDNQIGNRVELERLS